MRNRAAIKFLAYLIFCCLLLPTNASAFTKIKPQLAGTSLSSDGYFSGTFTNGAGAPVRITGVGGKITGASSQCIGVPQYPAGLIQPADNFRIELSGCAQGISPQTGDPYSFSLRIDYETEVGGQRIAQVDGGTLRGPYEGDSGKPMVVAPKAKVTRPKAVESEEGKTAGRFNFKLNPDIVVPAFFIMLVVAGFIIKFKKINIRVYRKKILVVVAVLVLVFVCYSLYILNIEKFTSSQQTLLLAQKQFVQDSVVSFRVVALDSQTQRPLENVRVLVKLKPLDGGLLAEKTMYSGATDPSGSAEVRFNISDEWDEGEYTLSVTVGEDTLEEDVRIVREAKILLTADKPIYQPNQIIHMRALVLKPFSLRPYGNETVVFELEDSKANKIFKKEARTNEFGVASTQLALADDINLGRYTIRAVFDDTVQEKKVDVKKYALPKFRIDFTADKDYYSPSEEVKALLSANYFFGKPVAEGDVDVRILSYAVEFKEVQHMQGKTDTSGNFNLKVNLPDYFVGLPLEKGNAFAVFNITVTDSAGHTESITRMIPVSSEQLRVEAFPESEELKIGLENTVFIVTSYPDGTPAETKLDVNGEKIRTNQLGIASFTIKPTDSAIYRLNIKADDGKGRKASVTREFSSEGGTEHMILRTDKAVYNVGETAVFNCIYSGAYGTKSVYIDLIKNKQTILTRAVDMKDNRANVAVDLTQDMVGTVEVHCYKTLRSTDIVRDVKHIIVNEPRDLKVEVKTDKSVYLPGEDAKISLRVTGEEGGVQSALEVKIVDESVYALEELQPGFEKLYFILESELMTPRYQAKAFSPYELMDRVSGKEPLNLTVVEPVPVAEAEKAAQVMIKIANLTPTDYEAKQDSYVRKEAVMRKTKEDYWSSLWIWGWATLKYGFMIGYVLCFISGLYWGVLKGKNRVVRILVLLAFVVMLVYYLDLFELFDYGYCSKHRVVCIILLATVVSAILGAVFVIPCYGLVSLLGVKRKSVFIGLLGLILLLAVGFLVWWQLGIFHMGATTLTATGGLDKSLTIRGFSAPTYKGEAAESLTTSSTIASRASAAAEGKPYLRQFFPETMYFNPSVITNEDGRADISLQMADSITTWRLNALASALDGRLGATSKGVRVFQDFFIDVDLPRILTQDDEVWIPIAVYNYLDGEQDVELKLTESDWFKLLDDANKTLKLKSNEVSVEFYHIKAVKHGMHKLTLYAYGSKMSDAISKQIEVVPYGEEVLASVSGALDKGISEDVYIPEYAVNGTGKVMVKIYPGYFSQVVEGLDKILRMPSGCFEQSSSSTYPDLLVLDYMKKTGQITPELQMKAENYVATGYQRLLNFETTTKGGFSWFGSPPPQLVMTAYGLQEFTDMSKVYNIDPELIPRVQKYIASEQLSDGSWEQGGQMHSGSDSMLASKLTSTCYITWSLAQSGYRGHELDEGISYIKNNMRDDDLTRPYTLALCANALLEKDGEDKAAGEMLEWLDEIKVEENNLTYWKSKPTQEKYETWTGSRGSMKDLEATALASLAYMKAGYKPQTTHRVLNYLIKNKDSYGTWSSTQATILCLKALVYAAEHLQEAESNATVLIQINGEPVSRIRVDKANSDVVQFIDLGSETRKGVNKVELKYAGEGNLYYQITGKYYSPWEKQKVNEQPLKIGVDYSTTTLKINDMATVNAKITYSGGDTLKLLIVDLGIPPGFSIVTEDLDGLKTEGTITRYDIAGRQLILYIQQLESDKPLSISYRIKALYPIKAKTPQSQVYEYYNPEVRDTAEPVGLTVTA